jgi:hypothetical protein
VPTIDQLAPATAAADTDEHIVSQSGTALKMTRAQILAGVQPQIALQSGVLLGRCSAGTGAPEPLSVGTNLSLANGTLSATAMPYSVNELPAGTVPAAGDLVPLSQRGTNTAVPYSQFISGLSEIANVDGSQLLLTPTGSMAPERLADFAAGILPLSGGTLTGTLTLAAGPSGPLQAATKSYVDSQLATALPKAGGVLTGSLVLAGDPSVSSQAATKNYVDTQDASLLPKSGGTLSGPLVLAGDPAAPSQAATKNYVDTQNGNFLIKSGGTLSGPLILANDPTVSSQAATKNYIDTQTAGLLPKVGGILSGSLTLAADPTTALQAATKEYVDSRVFRSGDTLTGPLILAANPISSLQAATKGYIDTQVATALPLAGGNLTGALSLAADPTSSSQAATKHYVDTQLTAVLPLSGGTLSGPLTLSSNPTSALQAAPKQYVDGQVTTALPLGGGTLTGALTLAGPPANPLNAATKQYVDSSPGNLTGVINVKSPPYNAQLNGVTDDTAAFIAAYQAAPSGSAIYVPNGVTVLQNPSSWGVALTKWVRWIVDGTTLSNGTCLADAIPGGTGPASLTLPGVVVGNSQQSAEISQGSSQPTDFSAFRTAYIVNHTGGPTGGVVSSNSRTDTIIYNSPNNYIWGSLDRLLWCGVQTSSSAPAQHVGRYIQTIRQSVGTNSNGTALPQPQMWAGCLEYRDTTAQLSSVTNSGITCEMDWFGNGPDDGHNRQIQSLVVGQNSLSGAAMEISTVVGIYLAAGHTGHAYTVLGINIPFSTSVLDTTAAAQMSGAAAIRMAAGHIIAFEPTVTYRLGFDSTTNVLRWYQGTLSYVIGKGISVGFENVCTSSTTLPNYDAGNIVFLAGSGTYTVTLPAAATVAAGTGFTFSASGTGVVSISPSGTDAIDNGPVTLRQNDRYQIISDGSSSWREVFRTNSVSPRFTGTPVLPSYTVAGLPAASTAGAKAFATNGRKPTEAAGAGSGVEVFCDGVHWISVCSGSQVLA